MIKTENILKERQMSVQAMVSELDRLYRQRDIIGAKRDEAQKAFYFGQNMRAQIRVEHEREQARVKQRIEDGIRFREQQREHSVQLGEKVMMMSTKCGDRRAIQAQAQAGGELAAEVRKYNDLVTELEAIQTRIMIMHKQKEQKMNRKANEMAKGGVKNGTDSAYETINASYHDALDEVLQMKDDLQESKDKIRDLDKRNQIQESQKRELEQMIAATERRLKAV